MKPRNPAQRNYCRMQDGLLSTHCMADWSRKWEHLHFGIGSETMTRLFSLFGRNAVKTVVQRHQHPVIETQITCEAATIHVRRWRQLHWPTASRQQKHLKLRPGRETRPSCGLILKLRGTFALILLPDQKNSPFFLSCFVSQQTK